VAFAINKNHIGVAFAIKTFGLTYFLCEWLTELIRIPFIPRQYVRLDLLAGLKSGEAAFTGKLTANAELFQTAMI
jgi:hypothetical protein